MHLPGIELDRPDRGLTLSYIGSHNQQVTNQHEKKTCYKRIFSRKSYAQRQTKCETFFSETKEQGKAKQARKGEYWKVITRNEKKTTPQRQNSKLQGSDFEHDGNYAAARVPLIATFYTADVSWTPTDRVHLAHNPLSHPLAKKQKYDINSFYATNMAWADLQCSGTNAVFAS
jgi:hypothetical protein